MQNNGQKLLAINGMPDHMHILIGMKPTCCLSDLIRELKKASSTFIKYKNFSPYAFQWQEGYGAFSYSHSNLNQVIAYIMNQKEHHKKKTFKEEYLELIQKFEIEHNPRNLFEWIDLQRG